MYYLVRRILENSHLDKIVERFVRRHQHNAQLSNLSCEHACQQQIQYHVAFHDNILLSDGQHACLSKQNRNSSLDATLYHFALKQDITNWKRYQTSPKARMRQYNVCKLTNQPSSLNDCSSSWHVVTKRPHSCVTVVTFCETSHLACWSIFSSFQKTAIQPLLKW